MNKTLMEINSNFGVVSDENGKLNVVSKENDKYSFRDILKKENEYNKLSTERFDLLHKLTAIKMNELFNDLAVICGLVLGYLVYLESSFGLWISMIGTYAIFKGCYLVSYDMDAGVPSLFRIGRIISHIKGKKRLKVLDELVPKMQDELNKKKEETVFLGKGLGALEQSQFTYDRLNNCENNIRVVDLTDTYSYTGSNKETKKGKRRLKTRNELTR